MSGVTKNLGHEIWPCEIVHKLAQLEAGSIAYNRVSARLDIAVASVAVMHSAIIRIVLKGRSFQTSSPSETEERRGRLALVPSPGSIRVLRVGATGPIRSMSGHLLFRRRRFPSDFARRLFGRRPFAILRALSLRDLILSRGEGAAFRRDRAARLRRSTHRQCVRRIH